MTDHPPSPLTLMKQSNRLLEFDEHGKPIHPLIDMLKLPKGKGSLPWWGSNFTMGMILQCRNNVLLVKRGRQWRLPETVIAKKMQNDIAANKIAMNLFGGESKTILKKLLENSEYKISYSNFDNFDTRNTVNAWIETTIYKWSIDNNLFDELQHTSNGARWFPIASLPSVYPLHRIIIKGGMPRH